MGEGPARAVEALAARAGWVSLALASLGLLASARLVAPHPSGLGTHRALGLPPCPFLAGSGLPCPTCGLTTGFAHLARGALGPALQAHPLSLPLFLLVVIGLVVGIVGAVRGRSPIALGRALGSAPLLRWLALTAMATWVGRLLGIATR